MEPSYRDRDFAFGQIILTLRMMLGMTQTALAAYLGISRRAVVDWETGSSYPKLEHLKKFIELAIKNKAFRPGSEAKEIRSLWRAAHQKVLLDEVWLENLLLKAMDTPIMQDSFSPAASNLRLLPSPSVAQVQTLIDWGDAPNTSFFYGRESELKNLRRWVIEERSQVIGLLGIGGIGKSALAVKLMHSAASAFEAVIWRSLRDAPDCKILLESCFQVLEPEVLIKTHLSSEQLLRKLLQHLQKHRVLLVLDNFEALLEDGEKTVGHFRDGYADYDRLLRQVAETDHQSCLLLTSREKPSDLVPLEGSHSPIRVLRLGALDDVSCGQLLAVKEVIGTEAARVQISQVFAGNPLALKIVAQTIVDLFGGEITAFLSQPELIFGEVRELLNQQFARLSVLEQSTMFWLAIRREPSTLNDLATNYNKPVARLFLLEAVEALYRRSMIERGEKPGSFTLQSVVMEYITVRLVTEVANEIEQGSFKSLLDYNLVQAQAKDYVRQSQLRLLVKPLLGHLQNVYSTQSELENHLLKLLGRLKAKLEYEQGYGPTNLATLLEVLRGDLRNLDLAKIRLRDKYLQGVVMQDTNLTGATIQDCIFTETFGSLAAMAISKDGEYWAALTINWELMVWKKEANGILRLLWRTPTFQAIRLSISPDGQTIAVASAVTGVRLWELTTGRFLKILLDNKLGYQSYEVIFSPEGKRLATVEFDAKVRVWDLDSGNQLHCLFHSDQIPGIAWSLDGKYIATGDVKGVVRLWEIPLTGTAVCLQTFKGHTKEVVGFSFAPDNQTLASASWDGTVKLWNIANGAVYETLMQHKAGVSRVVWSPDGSVIASGGKDKEPNIWLWDVAQRNYRGVLSGHSVTIRGLAFTPDSSVLISGSEDGTFIEWDTTNRQTIRKVESYRVYPICVDWSPDGQSLVSSGTDYNLTIYSASNQYATRVLVTTQEYYQIVVKWSPDGKWIATQDRLNAIQLWNAVTGEAAHILKLTDDAAFSEFDMEWSPDGKWLASGSNNSGLVIWDVSKQRLRWEAKFFTSKIYRVAWNPTGTKIATGGHASNSLYIWDAEGGTILQHLHHAYSSYVYDVAWSQDERFIAVVIEGSAGRQVTLWNTENWKQIISFGKNLNTIKSVCWEVSSNLLISSGTDGNLCWWDVESGECIRVRQAHSEMINSLKRSPDGSKLVSCSNDGDIKLWDMRTGDYLQTLPRNRPYERLNITDIKGLSEVQKAALRQLGAIEDST